MMGVMMYWISILFIMGIFMKFDLSGCESDLFPLANYCPANYEEARRAFINAVEKNESVSQHKSFCIGMKSPQETDLFIDVAVLGHLKNAKKYYSIFLVPMAPREDLVQAFKMNSYPTQLISQKI
jgi:hypothetical protein